MRRYVETSAMLASIIALALIKEIPLFLRVVILVISLLAGIKMFFEDYKKNNENIRICSNQAEIEDAMREIVRAQGKTCIMSRDLSWVTPEIKKILKRKKGNVRIFAQAESDLTIELISCGVEVYYYGVFEFEPKTRFTIIRYNRLDPQVAIAETSSVVRRRGFQHKIYETRNDNMQDRFICSLSIDLMEMCRLACEREMDLQSRTQ